mgnify:CR=1 FL=1
MKAHNIKGKKSILDEMKLDQALRLAKKKENADEIKEARSIYQDIVQKYPGNAKARMGIKQLTDPPLTVSKLLINLHSKGQYPECIEQARNLIDKYPSCAHLHNIFALSNAAIKEHKVAIKSYKKALKIQPDNEDLLNNLGVALIDSGDFIEAIEILNEAKKIKPDNPSTFVNLGNALRANGDIRGAIESFNKALMMNSDKASVYYNIGIALAESGEVKAAIENYKRAIEIKPNFAEAYNNLGIALNQIGKLEHSINNYKLALKVKPDYDEVYWNLYGTSSSLEVAMNWIEGCLKINENHQQAILTSAALKAYKGDKNDLNLFRKSDYKEHSLTRSINWVFNLPKLPKLFFHRWALFDYVMGHSIKERPFYEFGVWRGEAFKYLIKTFKKGFGFDTFSGLPEDWHKEKAGTYSSDGNIPKIEGGEFIVGKFEDTLPDFFSEDRPLASVINFDADLYSSTICALNYSKNVIDESTILIFDEFLTNPNWEEDEYKALIEFCESNGFEYEVIAISFASKQAAIKIVGI